MHNGAAPNMSDSKYPRMPDRPGWHPRRKQEAISGLTDVRFAGDETASAQHQMVQ